MGTIDVDDEEHEVDMSPMKEEQKMRSVTPLVDERAKNFSKLGGVMSEMEVSER